MKNIDWASALALLVLMMFAFFIGAGISYCLMALIKGIMILLGQS